MRARHILDALERRQAPILERSTNARPAEVKTCPEKSPARAPFGSVHARLRSAPSSLGLRSAPSPLGPARRVHALGSASSSRRCRLPCSTPASRACSSDGSACPRIRGLS